MPRKRLRPRWLLLGVLLIAFAIADGFDLGVAMPLPFVGRADSERRVVIDTVGPVWEGNKVRLLLGAGRSSPPGPHSTRRASRASIWR